MTASCRAPIIAWLLAASMASAAPAGTPLRSADSRKALIATGISDRYFAEHFKLVRIVDKPGDRRVVWRYVLNGYETIVTDAVGFYTEAGRRVDVHSFANTLGKTRNITRTIARAQARKTLRECLGSYAGEGVVFTRLAPGKEAGLYLTARTVSAPPSESQPKEAREPSPEKLAAPGQNRPAGWPPPPHKRVEGGPPPKRPPVYVGWVNLETGECTKIRSQVGSS